MVKNNQIHNGTINWFGKASRISDIQHIDHSDYTKSPVG